MGLFLAPPPLLGLLLLELPSPVGLDPVQNLSLEDLGGLGDVATPVGEDPASAQGGGEHEDAKRASHPWVAEHVPLLGGLLRLAKLPDGERGLLGLLGLGPLAKLKFVYGLNDSCKNFLIK